MEIEKTAIPGVLLIKPRVFGDNRGHFFESFNQQEFSRLGIPTGFVQDNQSMSAAGVLRGLHFQAPPHAQGKLVRVIRGSVLDVAVDIRKGSPTYGKWVSAELNEKNHKMMWIPEGMAHGFLSLEDHTIFTYKCTGFYSPEAEGSIRWNDPDIGIDWGISEPQMSAKDKDAPFFRDLKTPFRG